LELIHLFDSFKFLHQEHEQNKQKTKDLKNSNDQELMKIKTKSEKLNQENIFLKKRNANLQSIQLEIISKMKNFRELQMESDLYQKYQDELDDLEVIYENSEIFLDSTVGIDKSPRKLFVESTLEGKKLNNHLKNVDLSILDLDDSVKNKIKKNLGSMETAWVLINSFEQKLKHTLSNQILLETENGKNISYLNFN
jgi:hypothetical protein